MCIIPHRKAARPGLTVVEVAIVVSTVLLLLFGIFEYGRFLMTRQVMENAAREGARYAVVHTYDKSTADVQNVAFTALAGQDAQLEGFSKTSNIQVYLCDTNGNPVSGSLTWKDTIFGEPIAVRITGKYKPVLPSFLFVVVDSSGTIPLQVTAVMYSEAN
jgi:Flp pilus assembly protein TadG